MTGISTPALTCPWCGSAPVTFTLPCEPGENPAYGIGCEAIECGVNPEARAVTASLALAIWNDRKSDTGPSFSQKVAAAKARLHKQGSSLKAWAAEHGWPYGTVTDVTKGKNKATFGKGYEIAVALGLKDAA